MKKSSYVNSKSKTRKFYVIIFEYVQVSLIVLHFFIDPGNFKLIQEISS